MNKILQTAYFQGRVVKEVLRGRSAAEAAQRHKVSRMSVYRWMQRYDGSVEPIKEHSHRPRSHPNSHRKEEYTLIKRVSSANKDSWTCVSALSPYGPTWVSEKRERAIPRS